MSEIPSTRHSTAKWGGGFRAEVRVGRFAFAVDEPELSGGTDTGPQPTDYFLGSLASCFLLALAWAARKRAIELDADLTVEVVGTYDGPRFADLRVLVRCSTAAEVIESLLPAAERVCYVSNTLRRPPPITVDSIQSQADVAAPNDSRTEGPADHR